MIPTLCANLEELDEPEAKASLIWIMGEYAEKIDNADELLSIFVDSFTEESYQVLRSHFSSVVIMTFFRNIGAIADTYSGSQAFPQETRFIARSRAAGFEHCY